ncbi:MAG: hypothetical protein QOF36_1329 [Microbacteriaceae bacterium]|jgi:hypothetical protein|nr:hypothetical protein [Microbacteriaceae bacterium]
MSEGPQSEVHDEGGPPARPGEAPEGGTERRHRKWVPIGIAAGAGLLSSSMVAFALVSVSRSAPPKAQGPPTAAPTSPAFSPTARVPSHQPAPSASAWQYPVQPEDCGQLSYGANGSLTSSVVCSDGHPNVHALMYFGNLRSRLLQLKATASPAEVESAACTDLSGPSGGTIPIVTNEAELAFAANGWRFGGLTPALLAQELVDGLCSKQAPSASWLSVTGGVTGEMRDIRIVCTLTNGPPGIDVRGTIGGVSWGLGLADYRNTPGAPNRTISAALSPQGEQYGWYVLNDISAARTGHASGYDSARGVDLDRLELLDMRQPAHSPPEPVFVSAHVACP